jgi:hypothetical protein
MIQLTRSATVFRGSDADLTALRATFAEKHWLRLPQVVEPSVLETVRHELATCAFRPLTYGHIGTELIADARVSMSLLTLLFNDSKLFDLIQQITNQGEIGCFRGRVYRMTRSEEQHFDWHTDLGDERLVALSLNLAPEPYRGGVLQIRERASGRTQEVANPAFGDAIIFRVAESLEHCVTPVEGDLPRTAFGGWFRGYRLFTPEFPKKPKAAQAAS